MQKFKDGGSVKAIFEEVVKEIEEEIVKQKKPRENPTIVVREKTALR